MPKKRKKRKVNKSRKKTRKVRKSRKRKVSKSRKRKVSKSKKKKVNKSRKRTKKVKKLIFKAPNQSKDSDGNTIVKVSDSWANQAYVNESKYKKNISFQ